ncbi:hypothetical protein V1279_002989 [Bradyrhizobium sp. AZCC 1610]|uniref:hypothetical protein n=1 Tax=Bradyrhizobium sp. AZCC 1610 TaxID=3117020 RepID=UPI002FEE993A
MTVSACDYMDYLNDALGVDVDSEHGAEEATNAALAEVERLKRVEQAFNAKTQPPMDRLLYLVAPTHDQCPVDDEGVVSRDLFVWATDASEAVKFWRDYYEIGDDEDLEEYPLGITDKVRVFECPIMPAGATSAAIGWGDIHAYGATTTERTELP